MLRCVAQGKFAESADLIGGEGLRARRRAFRIEVADDVVQDVGEAHVGQKRLGHAWHLNQIGPAITRPKIRPDLALQRRYEAWLA